MISAAMLMGWLAQKNGSNAIAEASELFIKSVDSALSNPANLTPDLKGTGSTDSFGKAVLNELNA